MRSGAADLPGRIAEFDPLWAERGDAISDRSHRAGLVDSSDSSRRLVTLRPPVVPVVSPPEFLGQVGLDVAFVVER